MRYLPSHLASSTWMDINIARACDGRFQHVTSWIVVGHFQNVDILPSLSFSFRSTCSWPQLYLCLMLAFVWRWRKWTIPNYVSSIGIVSFGFPSSLHNCDSCAHSCIGIMLLCFFLAVASSEFGYIVQIASLIHVFSSMGIYDVCFLFALMPLKLPFTTPWPSLKFLTTNALISPISFWFLVWHLCNAFSKTWFLFALASLKFPFTTPFPSLNLSCIAFYNLIAPVALTYVLYFLVFCVCLSLSKSHIPFEK